METENLIGKIAHYPVFGSSLAEMTSSEIVSIKKLINSAEKVITIVTMADGAKKALNDCYFELSNETAS